VFSGVTAYAFEEVMKPRDIYGQFFNITSLLIVAWFWPTIFNTHHQVSPSQLKVGLDFTATSGYFCLLDDALPGCAPALYASVPRV
jgi:hypothetical protein